MSVDRTIEKILQYADAGLTSLEVLLFPAEQILEMADQEENLISRTSNVLFGLGMVSTITSFGIVYARDIQLDWRFKWIAYPVLTLILLAESIWIYSMMKTGSPKLLEKILNFGKPILYLASGGLVIAAMIYNPKSFFNMINVGRAIYLVPGIFALPPLKKLPFYPIVILVRAGGKITQLAAQVIELASPEEEQSIEGSSQLGLE
ncbi:hypothetical protein [Algoriphagus vanfongensis]|uniref:hypothetical protein n=1 Tax=Algoriphagus vanfongensis TaxID=426371 RepID=UPI000403F099|nr:hypothetical protein [Algoriphagus vanfongensis]